ncbi:hypothetical protein NDU88_002218 [Pleurodeles waltl]|uniref:Uncharacterized protein n=1 Tax=Pleurodeles waltl TaxID=8319 RepID=A0AAV7P6F5_PLEWA|nr:hypothetical protein NDU88_002218 [Pleurodeles waltl]
MSRGPPAPIGAPGFSGLRRACSARPPRRASQSEESSPHCGPPLSLPASCHGPPQQALPSSGPEAIRAAGGFLRWPAPRRFPSPRGPCSRSQHRLLPSRSQHPLSEAAASKASGSAPVLPGRPGRHIGFRLVGSR